MTKEDAKDLTLSILVILAMLLAADCVWHHLRTSRQADRLNEQSAALSALSARLEAHLNPPREPSLGDKTRDAYDQAKDATVRQYEKVKAAASAGYKAAKEAYSKEK